MKMLQQQGFTLLELLVVVSILAAVSGIGFFALSGDTLKQKNIDLAKVEMQNIATAVKKFKQDTGYFPGQGPFALLDRKAGVTNSCADRCPSGACDSRGGIAPDVIRDERHADVPLLDDRTPDMWLKSPVNFMQLIDRPVFCVDHPLAYLGKWDQVTGKGWNGPYLSREGFVDTNCTLSANNDVDRGYNGSFGEVGDIGDLAAVSCPFTDSSGATTNVLGNLYNLPAIADPFSSLNEYAKERGGILYWRSKPVVSGDINIKDYERGRIGQPYLLFFRRQFVRIDPATNTPVPAVSQHSVARLVSAGPDGFYGGLKIDSYDASGRPEIFQEDWCAPNIDNNPDAEDDIVLCF